MAKGRWKFSEEQVAIEAFSVLMQKQKPGRTLSKIDLQMRLKEPSVYKDFLKLCLEQDISKDLLFFRKGLLLVIKSIGISDLAAKTGLSRLSLYRMLSRQGNPRLDSLLAVFSALGLHVWLVDSDFIKKQQKVVRPKDIPSRFATVKKARDLGL